MFTFQEFLEAQLNRTLKNWPFQTTDNFHDLAILADAVMESGTPKAIANFIARHLKIVEEFQRRQKEEKWPATYNFSDQIEPAKVAIHHLMRPHIPERNRSLDIARHVT